MSIQYQINFDRFNQHLADVTLSFTAKQTQPVVWLPSWLAGSYLMREFARNITAIDYQINADKSTIQRANKLSKNEWQLTEVTAGDRVTVSYEVYCYDLSVRTAYVDNQRIFGNFSSLAVAVAGQEDNPVTATLCVPNAFFQHQYHNKKTVKIACGLATDNSQHDDGYTFIMHAPNYDELIDYPFEIAEQSEFGFATQDCQGKPIPHRFFISGRHQLDSDRLKTDVQRICQTYVDWLGDTPFSDYTFMTFASGNDYGGLEHINSTALVTPRDDLPSHAERDEPSEAYQRYLGLCSHEYFHAWWVKTVRPDVMMGVDLRAEAYTPLLWVFEGFTSYIDDFMLQASGVVSKASYLKLLTAQINRYNQTAGRDLQAVAESSFDAWIKLYRADENTGNAGISYYNKGALVALCLDLVMQQQTQGKYRLFDVVKRFYEKAKQNEQATGVRRFGMTDDNLAEVMGEFIEPHVWQGFYDNYVVGLQALPINDLLNQNGISVADSQLADGLQPWGMTVAESAVGLTINSINRDSVASEAGLSAKDVIIAIDGLKASNKQLAKAAHAQTFNKQAVSCHAFRRDELLTFSVPAVSISGQSSLPSLGKVLLGVENSALANEWLAGLSR